VLLRTTRGPPRYFAKKITGRAGPYLTCSRCRRAPPPATRTPKITPMPSLGDATKPSVPTVNGGEQPEPLSGSELRVLRYLPTNLTAPEIAAELTVSRHTVKTHMRHLYAKLGTHRRAEAVARARDLGLLAPSARR